MKELSECRVLVVDDVKANVDVLVAGLRGDYRISAALDGESALRIVEKSRRGQRSVLRRRGALRRRPPHFALSGRPSRTARETSLGLLEVVRRHATDAKQSDDITIVSVRYAPGG